MAEQVAAGIWLFLFQVLRLTLGIIGIISIAWIAWNAVKWFFIGLFYLIGRFFRLVIEPPLLWFDRKTRNGAY